MSLGCHRLMNLYMNMSIAFPYCQESIHFSFIQCIETCTISHEVSFSSVPTSCRVTICTLLPSFISSLSINQDHGKKSLAGSSQHLMRRVDLSVISLQTFRFFSFQICYPLKSRSPCSTASSQLSQVPI